MGTTNSRGDAEALRETRGTAGMKLTEGVGVISPAFELGALLLDQRRRAPRALLGEPDNPQEMCAGPAVCPSFGEEARVAHPARLEHAAVLSIATAAVATLRLALPSFHPHATNLTKGERNSQIEERGSPERVTARQRRPATTQSSRIAVCSR
jgi:hypothetical protein